ncbi:MAG: glycosyltransferase [Phycisphaerales bacterium]|nr:glycosyltransferase [Phycisphaerales bacterium]
MLVTDFLSRAGGTEYHTTLLARELVQRGHRVLVAVASPIDHPRWLHLLASFPVEIAIGEHDEEAVQLPGPARAALVEWLRAQVRLIHPDIIHCHPVGPATYALLERRDDLPCPIVATEASCGTRSCPWYAEEHFERIHQLDAVIATCDAVAEGIRDYFAYTGRVEVVPYFVASPAAEPRCYDRDRSDGLQLGYIGRLSNEKGVPYLLATLARLRGDHPEATLTLYGEGDSALVRHYAEALSVAGSVTVVPGFEPVAGIETVARQHDVFVLPSLFEGLPLSILELIVRGRPVVASPVGGLTELLAGSPHKVAPIGDSAALASAVVAVHHADRQAFHEFANASRTRYLAHAVVPRLLTAYERVISQRRVCSAVIPIRPSRVSIVLPARDRIEQLQATFRGLARQQCAAFEVIVVTDDVAVTEQPILLAAQCAGLANAQIRVLLGCRGSAAAARNAGSCAARGDVVLFLDAEVVPSRSVVAAHLELHCRHPRAVGLSPVLGLHDASWISRHRVPQSGMSVERWFADPAAAARAHGLYDARDHFFDQALAVGCPWTTCWSCALSLPREAAAAGFDEAFVARGSEDLELGLRLHAGGHRFAYLRSAPCWHQPHRRDVPANLRADRDNLRRLLGKHPCLEVELAVAFDVGNVHHLVTEIRKLKRCAPEPGRAVGERVGKLLPRYGAATLLVGGGSSTRGPRPATTTHPSGSAGRVELLGVALPDETGSRELVLISGWICSLPEILAAGVLLEACRVGREVLIVEDGVRWRGWAALEAATEIMSQPYWTSLIHEPRFFDAFHVRALGEEGALVVSQLPPLRRSE